MTVTVTVTVTVTMTVTMTLTCTLLRRAKQVQPPQEADPPDATLQLVQADAGEASAKPPKACLSMDVVAALQWGWMQLHTRASLLAYFRPQTIVRAMVRR